MTNREEQFYLRTAESVRREGGEVTRLYAMTAGEPVLVFSSKNRGDVERVRNRILQSLAFTDAGPSALDIFSLTPVREEWEA